MIFYFVGALLISLALFKLGQYAAIIAMITNVSKVAALVIVIAAVVLLYRKLRGRIQVLGLPWLSDE